jgi:hypothetical protein
MPLGLQSNLERWLQVLIWAGASDLRLLLEVCVKIEDPCLRESVFGFAFDELKLLGNRPQLVNVSKTAPLNREALLRVADESDLAKLLG